MDKDSKDGDLFLIRFIKQKPIIWDTSHPDYHDREKRNAVFKELGGQTNMNPDFLKRRWITQRERFVKDLRSQLLKNSSSHPYKYHKEMEFLKKYVKLRIQSPDEMPSTPEKTYEFEITEEDLKRHDEEEEDLSHLLIEFDDEIMFNGKVTRHNRINPQMEVLVEEEVEEGEISTTTTPMKVENIPEILPGPPEIAPIPIIEVPEPPKPPSEPVRNEDVIFGELIVSQLMKITDESKKKSIKRSILDLFF